MHTYIHTYIHTYTQVGTRTERESWLGKKVSKVFPDHGRFSGFLNPNPINHKP